MPTLKQLRLQARLSVAQLSRLADVDRKTVERAEDGLVVQDVKAYAIVDALAKQLGHDIPMDEIEGLQTL